RGILLPHGILRRGGGNFRTVQLYIRRRVLQARLVILDVAERPRRAKQRIDSALRIWITRNKRVKVFRRLIVILQPVITLRLQQLRFFKLFGFWIGRDKLSRSFGGQLVFLQSVKSNRLLQIGRFARQRLRATEKRRGSAKRRSGPLNPKKYLGKSH